MNSYKHSASDIRERFELVRWFATMKDPVRFVASSPSPTVFKLSRQFLLGSKSLLSHSLSLSSLTTVGRLSACLARHSGLGKFECHALISWTREEGRSFLPSFLLSFRRPASLLNGRKRSAVLAECCWSRCVKLREGWRCRCRRRRRRRRVVRVDCGVGVSDQRRSRAAASLASLHFGKRRAGSVTARSNSFV